MVGAAAAAAATGCCVSNTWSYQREQDASPRPACCVSAFIDLSRPSETLLMLFTFFQCHLMTSVSSNLCWNVSFTVESGSCCCFALLYFCILCLRLSFCCGRLQSCGLSLLTRLRSSPTTRVPAWGSGGTITLDTCLKCWVVLKKKQTSRNVTFAEAGGETIVPTQRLHSSSSSSSVWVCVSGPTVKRPEWRERVCDSPVQLSVCNPC